MTDGPRRLAVGILATAFLLAGCTQGSAGTGSSVTVVDPAVGAVPGDSAAVYLTLENTGADDSLVGAHCGCAESTSLHVTEDRNGVVLMVSADRVDVPSGETTVLDPGGSHLMLEGLDAPLEAGDSVDLTLEFDQGGESTVAVPVLELDQLAERVDR